MGFTQAVTVQADGADRHEPDHRRNDPAYATG